MSKDSEVVYFDIFESKEYENDKNLRFACALADGGRVVDAGASAP